MTIYIVDDNGTVRRRLEERLLEKCPGTSVDAETAHIWDLFVRRTEGGFALCPRVTPSDVILADLYSSEWDEAPDRQYPRAEEAPDSPENIKRGALECIRWLGWARKTGTRVVVFTHVLRSLRNSRFPKSADEVERALAEAQLAEVIQKPTLQSSTSDFDVVIDYLKRT